MNNNNVLQKYNRPVLFYSLSIAIPWCLWFITAYISRRPNISHNMLVLEGILGVAGLIAPMLCAFALMLKDADLRKDLGCELFSFKQVKAAHILIAVFLLPASLLAGQAISLLFGHSISQFTLRNGFSFTSGLLPAWFTLAAAPVFEELAWHSYGTNCLRQRYNLFITSMIFGLFWGIWHMPLSLIQGYYQNVVVETGVLYSINFLASIIPYVLLANWLYYKSGKNILVTILFHLAAGFGNEIFNTHPDSKVIQTVLLLILCAILLVKEKDFFFKAASVS